MRIAVGQPWERARPSLWLGLVASLIAHWLVVRSIPPPTPRTLEPPAWLATRAGDAEPGREISDPGRASRASDLAVAGGSTSPHNLDTAHGGAGGDPSGAYEVVLLVSELAPITLVDAPLNAADRSQVQRLDTAGDRASWEDRRATPHPEDDPFLASGSGPHRERREISATDAREGASVAPRATVAGDVESGTGRPGGSGAGLGAGTEGTSSSSPTAASVASGGSRGGERGAEAASPGRGILGGEGRPETSRAAVATGRPAIDLGPAATLAEQTGRVRDDVSAELLAASLFESRADASRRAGVSAGPGRGGAPGGTDEGTGGATGVGGSASPFGPGSGAYAALDTRDARYRPWLLAQRRRIEERLEFPRARQLARDQGTTVVRLVIRRDGSVATEPRVIRSSGFPDLDAAALRAVRESLPFPAVPSDVAIGRERLPVTLPIEFSNPMVR